MNIKEKYEKFSKWLEGQDRDKLKFIHNQNSGWREKNDLLKNFSDSYRWYKCVSELDKSKIGYILGDKIASLKDISKYMIKYISSFERDMKKSKKDWIKVSKNSLQNKIIALDMLELKSTIVLRVSGNT